MAYFLVIETMKLYLIYENDKRRVPLSFFDRTLLGEKIVVDFDRVLGSSCASRLRDGGGALFEWLLTVNAQPSRQGSLAASTSWNNLAHESLPNRGT